MIRRILPASLSNVRALAHEAKRRAVNAFHANVYVDVRRDSGCIMLGPGWRGSVGAGFVVDVAGPESWPAGARLLTIGRVTLAAWGGRPS